MTIVQALLRTNCCLQCQNRLHHIFLPQFDERSQIRGYVERSQLVKESIRSLVPIQSHYRTTLFPTPHPLS
ncbi:hypothetical protein [Nostoc sp.]|uniref:hypothetical protein n=1 Tax=Nostoc sp. TaxID=1180 RepID=UPI002FFA67A5